MSDLGLQVFFIGEISNRLRALDVANERHRTTENQAEIDAYRNALIDVGLAFGIEPKERAWLPMENQD